MNSLSSLHRCGQGRAVGFTRKSTWGDSEIRPGTEEENQRDDEDGTLDVYFANQLDDHEREELAMSDAAISGAMDAARVFLADDDERWNYINRQMAILDYNSGIQDSREEGRREGRREGIGIGRVGVLAELVRDGILTPGQAARKAEMTEKDFRKAMENHEREELAMRDAAAAK